MLVLNHAPPKQGDAQDQIQLRGSHLFFQGASGNKETDITHRPKIGRQAQSSVHPDHFPTDLVKALTAPHDHPQVGNLAGQGPPKPQRGDEQNPGSSAGVTELSARGVQEVQQGYPKP
jgi:hypothetical protein